MTEKEAKELAARTIFGDGDYKEYLENGISDELAAIAFGIKTELGPHYIEVYLGHKTPVGDIHAITDFEKIGHFATHQVSLSEGHYPYGENECLISEKFAEMNDLSIGDKITVSSNSLFFDKKVGRDIKNIWVWKQYEIWAEEPRVYLGGKVEKSMKFALCDDEQIWLDKLTREIEEYYGRLDVTCHAFVGGTSLLKQLKEGISYDAIFLDIEMPELDGMETAKEIRKLQKEVPILFLSSHIEYAMDGYEVDAFRFLSKPIVKEKLLWALEDIQQNICENQNIIIRQDGEENVININSIVYVEAANNYVNFVCKDTIYTTRMKLADVCKSLEMINAGFYRIHRSYLVNLFHVVKRNQNDIYMDNGQILPLSRSYAKGFKEHFLPMYVRMKGR